MTYVQTISKEEKSAISRANGFRTSPPVEDRLLSKMVKNDKTGCWDWQGAKTVGYGSLRFGGRRSGGGRAVYAHRVSYEWFRGPVPEGLHLDHLCENRACINPFHLEAVTQGENNRRIRHRRDSERVHHAH